jgi:hypothetical protein
MEGKKNEADKGDGRRKKKGRKKIGNRALHRGKRGEPHQRETERQRKRKKEKRHARTREQYAGFISIRGGACSGDASVAPLPLPRLPPLCMRPQRATFCPFCPEIFSLPLSLLLVFLLLRC